jgi:hypothetical protein
MPRFSLKRLFASITLISIGIALLVAIPRFRILISNEPGNFVYGDDMRIAGPLWFAGGAAIGAGIMVPYKRTLWGVKMGLKVQLALVLLMFAVIFVGAIIGSLLGG